MQRNPRRIPRKRGAPTLLATVRVLPDGSGIVRTRTESQAFLSPILYASMGSGGEGDAARIAREVIPSQVCCKTALFVRLHSEPSKCRSDGEWVPGGYRAGWRALKEIARRHNLRITPLNPTFALRRAGDEIMEVVVGGSDYRLTAPHDGGGAAKALRCCYWVMECREVPVSLPGTGTNEFLPRKG